MAEYKNIMVYVETAEGNPVKVGLEMLSPAKKLADKVTAVVIGGGVADAAKEVAKYAATLEGDEKTGANVVLKALEAPLDRKSVV